MVGQRFEVLPNGGEMELVSGAGEPSQAHSLEAVTGLQVRKANLNLFALIGHKNIQHTVRYTELSPMRFKDFWLD